MITKLRQTSETNVIIEERIGNRSETTMMKIGRIRFNPGNNKNKNNGSSAGTTANSNNNNNMPNNNSMDLLVDNQRQQKQEYDEIDGDCFSVFSLTQGEDDNIPISETGELNTQATTASTATSPLMASPPLGDDDASSTTKLVSNRKSSSPSKSPSASRRKDIADRRSKSPSSSRRSRTNRSKSPGSARRSSIDRSKSPNSSRRRLKNRNTTAGRDDSIQQQHQQQRHKFVQLGLSSGRDHEMVIGWVESDPEEKDDDTKARKNHHEKPPMPPPPPRSPSSKPATPTFSSSKTTRRQTRSLSPGTRRSRRNSQSQMMDGNQSVRKGSKASARRSTSPVATRQGRGTSLDKKQLRRKLKEEVLNVSSEMEISWHRNTGPLTSSARHLNNHSVVEKPGSTNSMQGQQYIPAHLRVYGAATQVTNTTGAGFKKPPLSPSTSTSSTSSPRSSSQKQTGTIDSTRKLLATITGKEEEEEERPVQNVVSKASSQDDSKGSQDRSTADMNSGGITTSKNDETVDSPKEESTKIETPSRRRRASKNSSTRVPASENPMSWRRENVVRTSSRCKSHSSTRKIKRIQRASKSTTDSDETAESPNKDSTTKMTSRRSNETDKNAYATLRRAEMLGVETTAAEKSEIHPRKSNSLDRPGPRAGRKIKFVKENNKTIAG